MRRVCSTRLKRCLYKDRLRWSQKAWLRQSGKSPASIPVSVAGSSFKKIFERPLRPVGWVLRHPKDHGAQSDCYLCRRVLLDLQNGAKRRQGGGGSPTWALSSQGTMERGAKRTRHISCSTSGSCAGRARATELEAS